MNTRGTFNLDLLKKKIAERSSKSGNSMIWTPEENVKYRIRIIPYIHAEVSVQEAYFHYLGGETILCPKKSHGEDDCPICDVVSTLFASKLEKDKTRAKQWMAKVRYFSPIIVREDGATEYKPYFWGYPESILTKILKWGEDPDYGDIADAVNGFDLKVEKQPKSAQNFYGTLDVDIAPKSTPLLKSEEAVEKLINSVPDLFTLPKFKTYSTDELAEKIEKAVQKVSEELETQQEETEKNDLDSEVDDLIKKISEE